MKWLVRMGLRQAWRRGVLGGNRGWIVVGGVALLGHLAGRGRRRPPDVVFSEELPPGQVLRIAHEPRR